MQNTDAGALDKKALREKMKALRRAAPDKEARSAAIAENFLRYFHEKAEKTVFLYRSFADEADTFRIADALMREGTDVCFPRVEGREMVPVLWTGQPFLRGRFGIEEPTGPSFTGRIGLCVLPLLAADGQFYRLGYGGGYYDRFLAGKNIRKAGICYDFQLVGSVPREPHDVPLDAIVTDKRILIGR